MELDAAIRGRRMCRDFEDRPVPPEVVDGVLDRARRAPSAGHTQGWAFVVLEGPEETGRFWALDASPAWLAAPDHPGLLRAPVVVLPLAGRAAYQERYAEPDKSGGSGGPASWDVPYWLVDTSFAVMLALLGAVDEGLGALFFALHGPPDRLLSDLGVPAGWQALGALLLGWPTPGSAPSSSAGRGRRPLGEIVHRGGW